ncbi:MAG: exodeoxyribonuclease VII small subunit [Solobacterium sp.]|nr:exodeoxyribonuclease VII small subunit [Solobacterium sp.]
MAKKELTFEEAMNRLNEIVVKLEDNEEPLDETIALFEEGLKLIKSCEGKLKTFEDRIEEIKKENGETDEL